MPRSLRSFLCVMGWVGALTAAAQAAGHVREGRVIAVDACSACHRVTPDQGARPPVFDRDEDSRVTAPSFARIARKYSHRPRALRRFIRDLAHPMPAQNWDAADLSAVVDFIQSLRSQR